MNFKHVSILIICLLGNNSDLLSQNRKETQRIDNLMMQIPDSSSISTDGIAGYVRSHFNNENDRTYAIYSWITGNIHYDVNNMFSIDFYQSKNDVVSSVLKSKTGVCLHFADLFQEIANKSDIKTYVILGYTKQNGLIDHIPHAWCASMIDTIWYIFDPAWGSGYFQDNSFHMQRNLKYYKVEPSSSIKTHMPFDPIWQFLNYPITNHDFYNRNTSIDEKKSFFNYVDSIAKYDNESELEKLESSIYRIKQIGITNVLIYRELKYMSDEIMTKKYNIAVNLYNESITQLNKSIMIWNEFNPDKNTKTITQLLDSSEYSLTLCQYKLSLIKDPSGFIETSINQLYTLLEIVETSIKDLRSSIIKYLDTRK